MVGFVYKDRWKLITIHANLGPREKVIGPGLNFFTFTSPSIVIHI